MTTLFELRGKKNLSQLELASLAGIGRDTLNRIENGLQKPTARVAHRITEALGVEPGSIDFTQQSRGSLPLLEPEPNSESVDRKTSHPARENSDAMVVESEAPQHTEESIKPTDADEQKPKSWFPFDFSPIFGSKDK